MALPSNVDYGTVTGRFLLAYADSSDVDPQPDGVPAKGYVIFTASPDKILDASASPDPVTILPASVIANLDAEGYIEGYSGNRGIRLVATDDADLNPVGWTWNVQFRLTDEADVPYPVASFNFSLPKDTTVDLAVVSPVPQANGTFYVVGPTGPANTLTVGTVTTGAAGSEADVEITGTAPSQTINFTIPQGIQGIQGEQGVQGIQGETGPIGPTGATGIEWQGAWSATVDYVDNDAVFYNGASWFASGNPPVGDVPSESSLYWFPLALQGATGPQGPIGPQGDAATIAVGTVTTGTPTTPASVTNVGTTGAAVFDFVIPKGETGSLDSLAATAPVTYASNTIGFDWSGTSLDDLGDVSAATPNDGDLIKWNNTSGVWESANTIDGGNA